MDQIYKIDYICLFSDHVLFYESCLFGWMLSPLTVFCLYFSKHTVFLMYDVYFKLLVSSELIQSDSKVMVQTLKISAGHFNNH